MRLKYIVEKKDKNNALTLREYIESEKDRFCLTNETVHSKQVLYSATRKGVKALIAAFRTQNMYPPAQIAERIADAVLTVLKSSSDPSVEVIVDEMEFVDKTQRIRRKAEPMEEESLDEDDPIEECSDETWSINYDEADSDLALVFPFDEVA